VERLGAVVLAAGRSSRMGDLKPLLEVDGRPLLAWAIGAFREAGVADVVVVAGHRRDEVAATAEAAGARVLTNADYDAGMYSSLRVGVLGLDDAAGRFFVLPADMPLVRSETIGRLVRQGRVARTAVGARAQVVIPEHGGIPGHPPLLESALRREIRATDPPGGLRELLDAHAEVTVRVPVDDLGVLLDADTPDDIARLRERASRETLPDVRRCLALLTARPVPRERVAHSLVVAGVAVSLTAALNARDQHLVAPLVTAGALLHDIARDQPHHAGAGADLLDDLGYPRVAAVVRPHARLGDRVADEPDEAQIVYLADKLVQGTRVVGLDARFGARLERYAGDADALRGVRERKEEAQRVLMRVEQALGGPIDEVLPEGSAPGGAGPSFFRRR
jgi:CTP:molybdopterin cytidylyltransferase MocA